MRRIAVFIGSTDGQSPAYAELAYEVGTELARRGFGLVYGGGCSGLMGSLSQGALDAGAEVIGVMPRAMIEREWARTDLADLRVCDTMHERKAIMAFEADAFLALPGGLGTLEEIFEVWTWRKLGFHHKPVGFLNAGDFWTPLIDALHGIVSAGFLSAETMEDLVVADTLPVVLDGLAERARRADST